MSRALREFLFSFLLECKPHTGRDFCSVEISEIVLKSWGSCTPDIWRWGWVGLDRPEAEVSTGSCLLRAVRALCLGHVGPAVLARIFCVFPLFLSWQLCEAGSNTSIFQAGVSAWQIAAQDASPSPPLLASEEGHPWGVETEAEQAQEAREWGGPTCEPRLQAPGTCSIVPLDFTHKTQV